MTRASQPVGVGVKRPAPKPRTKALGTIAQPYIRAFDNVPMVKISFSAPKVVAQQLQQYELKLKEVGIARNSWLTQLVEDGMDRRFLLEQTPKEDVPDVLTQVRAAVDAMRDAPELAQWVQRFDVALGDAKESA